MGIYIVSASEVTCFELIHRLVATVENAIGHKVQEFRQGKRFGESGPYSDSALLALNLLDIC